MTPAVLSRSGEVTAPPAVGPRPGQPNPLVSEAIRPVSAIGHSVAWACRPSLQPGPGHAHPR
jgi:hypothetical protein